jgi:hypothetical protein
MTRMVTMQRLTFTLLLLTVGSACAPTTTAIRPRTLLPSAMTQIEVGVGPDVLTRLFGPPDSTYVMNFGKELGQEWQGVAWRYYTARDTRYSHAVEFRRSVFYFYRTPGGDLKLNHWVLDPPLQGGN